MPDITIHTIETAPEEVKTSFKQSKMPMGDSFQT